MAAIDDYIKRNERDNKEQDQKNANTCTRQQARCFIDKPQIWDDNKQDEYD